MCVCLCVRVEQRIGKEKLTREADNKKFLLALDEVKDFFHHSIRCETAAEAMQEVMKRRRTSLVSSFGGWVGWVGGRGESDKKPSV